ncbi:hypothetical protein LTR37_000965 [Vermiconidia calcicola]|uniref:Uncharacterized protein n=1 Tax=Vermiconidia calcicola TaxID=1690605 RepID=A0ACC3NZB3_9PEZI|nr:hypothetical protein LTR37_000965 [Vermiconidia calcicola]
MTQPLVDVKNSKASTKQNRKRHDMIHLYVEHLLNIKTLSIQASLTTVSNKETKATISADGAILTLTHEGETASVKLPVNVSPRKQSNITLTLPAVPSRELSFRVQLEEKEGQGHGAFPDGDRDGGNVVPWTAEVLTPETEIRCRYCDSILVSRGMIRTWKNLPSEGWAEMMEFWHCHKPHEPHSHSKGEVQKGYTASSQLALESGVGMTATLHSDGQGGDSGILCSQCKTTTGLFEASTGAYNLSKLHLSVSTNPTSSTANHETQKWLACLLLCAMDIQGVRKFVVRKNADDASVLRLWIFTPDINVSSSAISSTESGRFAKVLWQHTEDPQRGSDKLNAASLSEGELKLQGGEMKMLCAMLKKGGELMPEAARHFQDWNVGLLERFTASDIAPS